jgi:predicted transcriptional regulator
MKRDKIKIMHDMLELISTRDGKARPTHIMYKANLSHEMLVEYMNELKQKGFITEHIDKDNRRTYKITEKGSKFIAEYRAMTRFLTAYDLSE